MGHLFSRAFKRLTQCSSQSRNESQPRKEKPVEQQDQHDQSDRPVAQAIPVGQSIDSADYTALTSTNNNEFRESHQHNDQENNNREEAQDASPKQQDVEGAVIKIQALVRGHLTRKALKDAHQHSAPPLGTLGQSQFDEESLTKNPPSAVFLPSSPLHTVPIDNLSQQQGQATTKTPLESIAEVFETPSAPPPSTEPEETSKGIQQEPEKHSDENGRKKLSELYCRTASSGSKSENRTRDSMSPAPSEANASIDLNCDTPASASIDISDHNLKPTERIASVLHLKRPGELATIRQSPPEITQPIKEEPSEQEDQVNEQEINNVVALGTPDSLDSEEAAAIRIQSAFRGYRTRKNSPYRTRSPTSSPASQKRNFLRQQEATVLLEEEYDTTAPTEVESEIETSEDQANRTEGRRSSRARQRGELGASVSADEEVSKQESNAAENDNQEANSTQDAQHKSNQPLSGRWPASIIQGAPSLDEFTTTTEDTTVKEIKASLLGQHEADTDQTALSVTSIAAGQLVVDDETSSAIQMGRNGIQLPATPSLSLDIGDLNSAANTLDEPGLSAALEVAQTTTNSNYDEQLDGKMLPAVSRPSIGARSDASVELDTDSSVLGAALSLTEDLPLQQPPIQTSATTALEPIDEDRLAGDVSMTTDELESEARRLVDEMTGETERSNECALEEATNQLEEALEDATAGADDTFAGNEIMLLNEEEQRAIELESDDIERRDPRGQVSEERAKSPQIRGEETNFDFGVERQEQQVEYATADGQQVASSNLNVEPLAELGGSGRSSPAFNSSGCGSSSGEENSERDEDEEEAVRANSKQNEANQKRQQQPTTSTTPTGRNKKRNRNKKRGKK